MKALASHLRCLDELGADAIARRARPNRATALGLIAAGTLVALAIAGTHLLEQAVLEKLGAR